MTGIVASIDPEYTGSPVVGAQPYSHRGKGHVEGLAKVRIGELTIQSLDTTALRALAGALREAADLADAITHRSKQAAHGEVA